MPKNTQKQKAPMDKASDPTDPCFSGGPYPRSTFDLPPLSEHANVQYVTRDEVIDYNQAYNCK